MYDELYSVDQEIFEALLNAAGVESILGYAEATITLIDAQQYYRLPPGFRQLIHFKRYDTTTGEYLNRLKTQQPHSQEYGVQIISADGGMMLDPSPKLDSNQDWTLKYLRGAGKTFYGTATSFDSSAKTLTYTGTVGTDAGEYLRIDDYYNGMLMRIYADTGGLTHSLPFVSRITDFVGSTGVFTLQDTPPLFTGTIGFEILPCLPDPYFKLHTYDVALRFLSQRTQPEKFTTINALRDRAWNAAKGYVLSNTMDRGPTKIRPVKPEDRVPTGETVTNFGY